MLRSFGSVQRSIRWLAPFVALVVVLPVWLSAAPVQASRVPLQSGDYAYLADHDPNHRLTATVRPTRTHAPWVIVIHGGSWVRGSQKNVANVARLFARNGFQVFNVSYRLDGVTFGDQQQDLRAAATWIRAHAARFGLDPSCGSVYGFSAGGQLAAWLGSTGGFRVVVSISGVLQPQRVAEDAEGLRPHLEPSTAIVRSLSAAEEHIVGCSFAATRTDVTCRRRWRSFEPQHRVRRGDPAMFIAQGESDPCVPPDTARAYAYWLDRAHVPHVLITVPGFGHTDQVLFASKRRQREMLRFVAEHSR